MFFMIKFVSQKIVSPVNYHTKESEYVIENQDTKKSIANNAISSFLHVSSNPIPKLANFTVENKKFSRILLAATVFASQFLNAAAKNGPNSDTKLTEIGSNLLIGSACSMLAGVGLAFLYGCYCECFKKKDNDEESVFNKKSEKCLVGILITSLIIGLALILTAAGLFYIPPLVRE